MFSWTNPQTPPIIVAHRGASAFAPENTLAAFRRAIDEGTDAIELDVQLSKDGEVVVFHDLRIQRTTDGSGGIGEHTCSELKRFTAGRWFDPSFESERIPTLHEVFEVLPPNVGLNIELKTGSKAPQRFDIAHRCCDVIREHRAESVVLVSSFQHLRVAKIKRYLPEVTTGLLIHPLHHFGTPARRAGRRHHATYVIFGGRMLRKRVVQKLHDETFCVGEFTVNTRRRFERAVRFGVNAVITDDPGAMIALRTQVGAI